jgi:hypothetical protein
MMNKNLVTPMIALIAGLGLLAAARAELIVYEGFDYAPGGSLEGRGDNGFFWGTNLWLKQFATSDWLTVSNSLLHPSIPATGGHVAETNNSQGADYERKFALHTFGDNESIWFSFLVRVTQGASWDLFFTFSGLNSNKFGVRADYVDYKIRALIGVGYNGSDESINLGQNTTRLVVGRYRFSQSDVEQLDLWMDPDIASEPQPGGLSSSNHIVHLRQHESGGRIDSVLLEDRSIGSLAFDELRLGTSWADVISRALDKVSIDRITTSAAAVTLELSRLTPGATTRVQRATALLNPQQWVDVDSFVPSARSTSWTEPRFPGEAIFYRAIVR